MNHHRLQALLQRLSQRLSPHQNQPLPPSPPRLQHLSRLQYLKHLSPYLLVPALYLLLHLPSPL